MSALDREARASRYLDAMASLEDLVAGRMPGLDLPAEKLGQLLSVLNAEARKVVVPFTPDMRAVNDDGEDG